MADSSLVRLSLQLNHYIQHKIFHYSQLFTWNDKSGEFIQETRLRKLVPWLLINFVLLPWVAIVNSIVVLSFNFAGHYDNLNVLQKFILLTQCLITIAIVITAVIFLLRAEDWVTYFNILLPWKPRANTVTTSNLYRLFRSPKESLFLSNGRLDIFGILTNLVIGSYLFLDITLPPFVFIFHLDAPYHFFKFLIPPQYYTILWSRTAIQFVRVLIRTLSVYEGVNIFRTLTIYFFVLFKSYEDHLFQLTSQPVSYENLKEYTRLSALFALINESLSVIAPTYLGIIYWVLVLINTINVLGLNVIPWYFYISIPPTGVFIQILLGVVWRMATLLDERSKLLKLRWKQNIGKIKMGRIIDRRIWRRMVNSLRPISIKYGDLGTMKTGTRRDYMHSLSSDTVDMIIGWSERDFVK